MAINGGDTLADQLSNALALKTRISFYYLKSATIIQYTIKGRFMSR